MYITTIHVNFYYAHSGTIGILLGDRVKKVYGIELIESAVEDAKQNCANNGETCQYLHSKIFISQLDFFLLCCSPNITLTEKRVISNP